MTITNPFCLWHSGRWHRVNKAGIADDAPFVELDPPNPELEERIKKNLQAKQQIGSYTLDHANGFHCLIDDLPAYRAWEAIQLSDKQS